MAARYYTNGSPASTLSSGVNSSATSLSVGSVTGWPGTRPYTVTVDIGLPSVEVCLVTAVTGTTLTVTRGYNGTTGVSHTSGAAVQPTAVAMDYQEANTHNNATTGVHGISGAVVGTSDTQTLSGKTLSSPVLTGTTTAAAISSSGTISTSGAVTAATVGATSVTAGGTVQGAVVAATGNATVGGTLGVTGATTLASASATSLGVSGNTTLTGTLGVTGTTTVGALVATTASVASAPSGASHLTNKAYVDRHTAYSARAYRAAGWTAATGYTDVVLDTENYDNGSAFNTSTGTYTVPVTGIYMVTFCVGAGIAAGAEAVAMLRTSANVDLCSGAHIVNIGGTANFRSTGASELYLTSGTVLKLSFYNGASAAGGSNGSSEAYLSISFRG